MQEPVQPALPMSWPSATRSPWRTSAFARWAYIVTIPSVWRTLITSPKPDAFVEPADASDRAGEGGVHVRVRPALDVDPFVHAAPAVAERRAEVPVQGDEEELAVGHALHRFGELCACRSCEQAEKKKARKGHPGEHSGG